MLGGTRDRLLVAARQCVREHGVSGATSRRITTAAGANLAAITYHFGSKEALLMEALFGELRARVQPALDALAGDGPPGERMLLAVQRLLAELERSQDDALVALEALVMAAHDPDERRRVVELHESIRAELVVVLRQLLDDGVVPGWVVPEAMASLIIAVANGIVLQTQLDCAGPSATELSTQFAGLLLASAANA